MKIIGQRWDRISEKIIRAIKQQSKSDFNFVTENFNDEFDNYAATIKD